MKRIPYLFFLLLVFSFGAKAQKIDSIFFHLYTDSLKKGTYNYINVDGKLSNGTWLPLTSKQLLFTCSAGTFEGNSLFIDKDFKGEKVIVKATLKNDSAHSREIIIYIKKFEDNEKLKTSEEIFREMKQQQRKREKGYT